MIPSEFLDATIDIFIKDQGSTNGTVVNDEQVTRRQQQNMDCVHIAWTEFKLVSDKNVKIARTPVMAR